MQVFNPGEVPVVVDNGVLVPAGAHAEVEDGPRVRDAVTTERLLDQTEPAEPAKDPAPKRADKGAS